MAVPRIRLIADSAIAKDGRPLFLPDLDTQWKGELLFAIRISRLGKNIPEKFAGRYFDAMTLVHLLSPSVDNGSSTDIARAMDSALICGSWLQIPKDSASDISSPSGSAHIDMNDLGINRHIHEISRFVTFKTGDILVFRSAKLPVDIISDTYITGNIGSTECIKFKIK